MLERGDRVLALVPVGRTQRIVELPGIVRAVHDAPRWQVLVTFPDHTLNQFDHMEYVPGAGDYWCWCSHDDVRLAEGRRAA